MTSDTWRKVRDIVLALDPDEQRDFCREITGCISPSTWYPEILAAWSRAEARGLGEEAETIAGSAWSQGVVDAVGAFPGVSELISGSPNILGDVRRLLGQEPDGDVD